MGKKSLKLSIDEFVLKNAKEKIPNLSALVEETLRIHLDSKDSDEYRIRTQLKAQEDSIRRAETQIDVLNSQLKLIRDAKYSDKKEKDRAWRGIYDQMRTSKYYTDEAMDNAVRVLGWDKNRLHDIVEYIVNAGRSVNALKCQEWDHVKEIEGEL